MGGVRDDIGPCGAVCQRGGERERKALAEAGRWGRPTFPDGPREERARCMHGGGGGGLDEAEGKCSEVFFLEVLTITSAS